MMPNKVEIKMSESELSLFGDLDFNNVMRVYQQGVKFLATCSSSASVNFAGLNSSNSVVVALIVDWMKIAKEYKKNLQLLNLSTEIKSLIKAAGLETIISF